jgi:DNA-binding transcriptional MerR regulator
MITPQQVYTELDISPATLRRWAAAFADYLSPQVPGKKRSYTATDLDTLRRIRDLSEQGVRLDAIAERLQLVPDAPGAELIRLSDYTQTLIALREQNEQLSARVDALEKTLAMMQLPWWKRITQRRGKS